MTDADSASPDPPRTFSSPNPPRTFSSPNPRQLTDDQRDKLAGDVNVITDFKQQKLEREAQKNWDLFYKRNTTKFFKDRHWTTREFQDLVGEPVDGRGRLTVLEVGCGVGNFVFPLLEEIPDAFFYACDFSPRAVQFVKDNPSYHADRCHAFQNDLTSDPLTSHVPSESVDIVTMIFVLSAINPDKMADALRNVYNVLKPGGCVLIRDYGLHDHAMLRFAPGHKLSDNFYMRQDGTRAYYFTTEYLSSKFGEAGLTESTNEYVFRQTVNKKEGINVPRVFVQGKFVKAKTKSVDNSSVAEAVDNLTFADDEKS